LSSSSPLEIEELSLNPTLELEEDVENCSLDVELSLLFENCSLDVELSELIEPTENCSDEVELSLKFSDDVDSLNRSLEDEDELNLSDELDSDTSSALELDELLTATTISPVSSSPEVVSLSGIQSLSDRTSVKDRYLGVNSLNGLLFLPCGSESPTLIWVISMTYQAGTKQYGPYSKWKIMICTIGVTSIPKPFLV
jgi:hypothetical protein